MNWKFWLKPKPEPEIERAPIPAARPVDPPAAPVAASRAQRAVPQDPPKVIPTYVLASKFVRWLQNSGSTGYYLVSEIDELAEAFCTLFNYEVPGQQEFRSYLAETRGVTRGRYRLKSWEFREVARRTTIEKPVLYRIPSKMISDTISSDFYLELANGRPMGANGHSEGANGRTNSGPSEAPRQRRAYPKRKMVLKPSEIDGNREAA